MWVGTVICAAEAVSSPQLLHQARSESCPPEVIEGTYYEVFVAFAKNVDSGAVFNI
jgi:hypothetical protein